MNMNDVNEVIKLLDGHYAVKPLARSRMDPEPEPLPTEIHNVMRDHIYQDAGNKTIFQQALKILLSGNASEVYLAFAYFDECLLQEKYYSVSFQIDKEAFVPLLQEAIRKHALELEGTIIFWNGVMSKGCLDRIRSASGLYLKRYEFSLLPQSPDEYLKFTDDDISDRVRFIIKDGELRQSPNTELLRHLIVPEGVTKLGYGVFSGHRRLEKVTLPQSLREIGYGAFAGCVNLRDINILDGVTVIYEGAFRDCASLKTLMLPDSVQDMRRMIFTKCESLETVKLPNLVTSIGEYTFSGCHKLRTVIMPANLRQIIHDAFLGCESITEITVPEKTEEIWFEAFMNCTALRKLRIPVTLQSFGRDALKGCTALETIELYGTLPKDKAIPEWLANMAFDDRSNARDILTSEGRIDAVINNTYPEEMYLNSVFDSEIKIEDIKRKKKEIIHVLLSTANRQSLNSELTKVIPSEHIPYVLKKFKKFVGKLPANPEEENKRKK